MKPNQYFVVAILGIMAAIGLEAQPAYAGPDISSVPAATVTCVLTPDTSLPDKPPEGTYSWVPFTADKLYTEGDFGKDGAVTKQRMAALPGLLNDGMGVWLADKGIKSASSMAEASGMVITGEVLFVDAGSVAGRVVGLKSGTARVKVLFHVVDAASPEKKLASFLITGEHKKGPTTYIVPGIMQKPIPKAIWRALKKPSKSKTRKAGLDDLEDMEKARAAGK